MALSPGVPNQGSESRQGCPEKRELGSWVETLMSTVDLASVVLRNELSQVVCLRAQPSWNVPSPLRVSTGTAKQLGSI